VALDDIDVLRRQARLGQSASDDALLGWSAGGGQPVRGTILVDRATAQHGQDLVAVATGLRHALQDDHADALGKTRAIRGRGVRLAPAVGGETALAGELYEGVRAGHDGRTACKGERALSAP